MQRQILLILLASFFGCQKIETTGPAVAGAKTKDSRIAGSPTAGENFRQMVAEPVPDRPDFCNALAWSEKLSNFMFVNQEELEQVGLQTEISAEYERRGKARDEALVRHLRKNLVIPRCKELDGIHDPVRWLLYAHENKRIPRELLLAAFKTAVKGNQLRRLRSDDWDEQESVHLFWRLIPAEFDMTADELREIGLTPAEIKNVFKEKK